MLAKHSLLAILLLALFATTVHAEDPLATSGDGPVLETPGGQVQGEIIDMPYTPVGWSLQAGKLDYRKTNPFKIIDKKGNPKSALITHDLWPEEGIGDYHDTLIVDTDESTGDDTRVNIQ